MSGKAVIDQIADPDELLERPGSRVIKDQAKIKVGRVILELEGAATGVYVKRYNAFSLRYRWLSMVRTSGALRSLRGAMILARAGISTPRPLAAVEVRRWGMLQKSFFLSEEISGGKTADAYWREELKPLPRVGGFKRRRSFLGRVAGSFRQLHDRRIYHNDLKDANWIVQSAGAGSEELYLLDLEGVGACSYLSRRRQVKNLVQLNRTLGRLLSRTERLYLLRSYLGKDFDRERIRQWIRRILPMSLRADRRSAEKTRPSWKRETLPGARA